MLGAKVLKIINENDENSHFHLVRIRSNCSSAIVIPFSHVIMHRMKTGLLPLVNINDFDNYCKIIIYSSVKSSTITVEFKERSLIFIRKKLQLQSKFYDETKLEESQKWSSYTV